MAVPGSPRITDVPRIGAIALGVVFGLTAVLALGGDDRDPAAVRLIAAPAGTPIRHSLPAVVTGSTSWSLRDDLTTGPATVGPFSYGARPLVPLFGDWDGNGSKTPGTYEAGSFKLRNSNADGAADLTFAFGDPRGFAVAGDFNNDGLDDVAVYRAGLWQIHYIGTGVPPDESFSFGSGSWPSTVPVVGDWNGDGTDGIGTYTLASGTWNLRNTATTGAPDLGPFVFWSGSSSSYPVTGDWDADGTDTVGVKSGTTWSLTNTPGGGAVATTFTYGAANDLPLTWMKAGPALSGIENPPLAYTTNTAATSVTSTIIVADPDKATLTGATVTIGAGYQNGQDLLSFTNQLGITGTFAPATGTMALSGAASLADYQTALRAVKFSTSSSNTTPRTVTFQVNDGSVLDNLSNPLSRDISVTATPAAVTVTKSEPTPGAGTTVIAGQTTITYLFSVANSGGGASGPVTITDTVPSGTTLVGGSLTCPAGLNAGSTPSCTTATGPPLSWTLSSVPALTTYDSFGFQVTVNAGATNGSTVANQATFTNVNTPGCATLTCTTNTVSNTVNVPPTATIVPANGATDISASSTITVTFSEPVTLTAPAFTLECPAGTPKAFTVSPASPASVFTLTPTSPFASFASCTVTVVATQVTDSGGAKMTANAVSSFQAAATPTAVPQSYSGAVGNTSFGVGTTPAQPSSSTTGSVLDGATNGGAGTLSAVTTPITSTNGGSVTMNADGSFTYLPPVGFTGNDTFTYAVTNTFQIASNTVTITVAGKVWYVDNSLGVAGTGRSTSPFNSLTPVNGAGGAGDSDAAGDFIFLKTGSSNYDGGLVLENNQQLIGQPQSLVVNGVTLWTGAGSNPTITNAAGAGINLASGTVVRRVNVANTSSAGISGSAITTADIGPNLTVTNSGGAAFSLFGAAGGNVTFAGSITHSSATGRSVSINNRSSGTVTISGSVTDTAGGVAMNGNTGATINFTGGLSIATGLNEAFRATGGGTVNVTGTNTLSSTGAVSLEVSGTTIGGSGLTFQSIAKNGGANGIVLNTTGAGFLTVTGTGSPAAAGSGGTIQNTTGDGISLTGVGGVVTLNGIATSNVTGTDVLVSGGAANVTYAGTITNQVGKGKSVDITGRTGGTILFSGAINDSGNGITLTSNGGGTINFTGGLTLSTGGSPAFTATGGGTVSVTGSANTIVATTTALNVANTTIGGSGLTFRSISANGGSSGIILNNTESSAGLTVTGTGGAGTGGTIQNSSAAGISLLSTMSPSFASMSIQSTVGSGIDGSLVTNFSLTNSTINNSGTVLAPDTSSVAFNSNPAPVGTRQNLSGTVTITGNTLTNASYQGVDIFNFAGTIDNATISNNTITSSTSTATSKGSGIRFVAFGNASTAASITKATLDNNDITNFPSGVGLQVQCGNANSSSAPISTCGTPGDATNVINITNNDIHGASAANRIGAEGMVVLVNGRGQGNFNISGNDVRNVVGIAISHSAFGLATVTSTISNNTIVANNGGFAGQGIGIGTERTGGFATNAASITTTVSGNNISQVDGNGILAVARGGSGTLRIKVLNNVVAAPLSGFRQGISIQSGNESSVNETVCLDISGNTSAASVTGPAALGIGLRKQGTVPTTNAFGIKGMSLATATPAVEAYVNGLNPAGGGTLLQSALSGFTNCSLP